MRSAVLCSSLLLCTASAWSFQAPPEIIDLGRRALGLRDDSQSTTFDLSFSATEGATSASSTTASITQSASGGSRSNSTITSKPNQSTQTFDPVLGPGGISMITPNPISGATYYKIADVITMAWNYTSVSVLPSAVDILAVGASNSATWTLALNQSVSGATQAFTWDTGKFQASATVPLLTESYTLVVYDAAKDVSAIPSAGYLGTANQFVFAMYSPSPYTSWNDWKCVTCSAADAAVEKRTIGFICGMAAVTVLSFTWFSGVAGLW